MNICVVGAGHVGLVTGACFADLGNQVLCVDNDTRKLARLAEGEMPFYEPGMKEMVLRNVETGRLTFGSSIADGVESCEIIFISVGTPPLAGGDADLSYVESVAQEIAGAMREYRLIVEKSTVPVETGHWVTHTLQINVSGDVEFDVASNPEFLQEGTAVRDFMEPDRVVLGVESARAERLLTDLYRPLGRPILVTDIRSAEIIKHASNSFLATKISFINAVAQLCDRVGADVEKVAEGMGLDPRIGPAFLKAGAGFGGFCLPKDLDAFIRIAERCGYDFELLKAVRAVNEEQKRWILDRVKQQLWIVRGKTVAILGLSFKPGTDDMRFAPSVEVIEALQTEGAKIRAFDPQARAEAEQCLTDVEFCEDAYAAVEQADCVIIMTEWNQFKELDLERIKMGMKQPVMIDGRNIYEPQQMEDAGFTYVGVGRGRIVGTATNPVNQGAESS